MNAIAHAKQFGRSKSSVSAATDGEVIKELLRGLLEAGDIEFALWLANDSTIIHQENAVAGAQLPPGWDRLVSLQNDSVAWGFFSRRALTVCWFPVVLGSGRTNFIVMIRQAGTGFQDQEVQELWYASQRFLSSRLGDSIHERFTAMARTLNLLIEADDNPRLLHSACHYAVSPLFLAWDRFWLFAQDRNRPVSFTCIAAHGSLRTGESVSCGRASSDDDDENRRREISDALSRLSDNDLAVLCAGKAPAHFEVMIEAICEFYNHPRRGTVTACALVCLDKDKKNLRNVLMDAVRKCCKEQHRRYQSDSHLYCVPVRIGGRLHLRASGH